MRRTSIFLTERQLKAFSKEAAKLGIATAELIRRVLDKHLQEVNGKG
jgi:hypothetical protein